MERLRGPSPLENTTARHPAPLGPAHRDGLEPGTADRVWDVCVIGSGASGAVAADRLVRQGLDVLMVEEGFRLAPHVGLDEAESLSRQALARDGEGNWTDEGWPWTTSNLGGGTVYYGGASFRYRPFDFDPGELVHTDGVDVRWPYTLADLVPYYEVLERRLGVCGGDAPGIHRGSRHSRGPAHQPSPAARVLRAAGESLGYRPFPTPLAINRDPHGGRAACARDSLCVSHLCPTGAKGDVVAVFLAPLAAHPNFALRTGVRALRLEQDRSGEVAAVRCLDRQTGQAHRVRARVYVVACNAIQSAALLLRSRTPYSPDGVGNHSHLVGRGLCMKLSEYLSGTVDADPAVLADPYTNTGPFSTVAFLDHYLDPDCPGGFGGLIYESKRDQRHKLVHDALELRIETILADHPNLDNRVGLSTHLDEDGMPAVVIDYTPDPRDLDRLRYMTGRCERLLRTAGARGIRSRSTGFAQGSSHLHGTCRAGHDPARSVVDAWGRVHSADNVYIVDGSFMPYPGGLNPTLTIQAHALRTSRAIASHLAADRAAHV
uniref:6'''-hydroxyparomomycin C oxidase n=1 Tax=Streptomyces lividus TaxID=282216 RepID=LIVQ_STRLV|nr:RecName: Full=6'''-hydroxyparomomycin C oxidase; AltName: Full=Lividomycin biosynthesis protein Q [Streptomyces lividus]CAG38701.1 putative lividomycin 6'-dehydrogenase [Streptomyces lividus]